MELLLCTRKAIMTTARQSNLARRRVTKPGKLERGNKFIKHRSTGFLPHTLAPGDTMSPDLEVPE